MAKWVHSDVLDNGISAIKANANKQVLLKAYVPGDSYSTVNGTNKLAEVAMASGDYTLGNGSGSSRTLTTAAGKSATASASSGATPDLHIAFVDTANSKVLWVTETSNASVTAGDTVNFPALAYTADQPPGAMSAMSQYVDEVAAGRGATLGSAQQQQILSLVSPSGISAALVAAYGAGMFALPAGTRLGTIASVPTAAILLDAGSGGTVTTARVTFAPPTDTIGAQRLLTPTAETYTLTMDSALDVTLGDLGGIALAMHAIGVSTDAVLTSEVYVAESDYTLAEYINGDARFEWLDSTPTRVRLTLQRGASTRYATLSVVAEVSA